MTGGEILIVGKLALTFAILLGIPCWELYRLRRERRRRRDAPDPPTRGR